MRIHRAACLFLLLLSLLPHQATAADLHPFALPDGFTQDVLAQDLGPATAFAIRPDGSILIARKHGSVKVWRDGEVLKAPFIDISGEINRYGDRGLMGIAVHPNFPQPAFVYLAYAYEPSAAEGHEESGARTARVIRVEALSSNPDKARDGSTVVLLGANGAPEHAGNLDRGDRPPYSCMDADNRPVRDCLPVDGPSHTVDGLVFGPDGALYVSAGDGTLQPDLNVRAQNLDSLAGKVLRIDPITGKGYPNNPFSDGDPGSNRSKVYALGLRNPYRFTFDPAGQLVVGDVGGERWEEINRGGPGSNFGWPCLEGPVPNSGDAACSGLLSGATAATPAWHSYSHADGYSAAIGGDFYTGGRYPAAYNGAYFFADHNRAALLYLPPGAPSGGEAELFATNVIAPVQISMGPDGALYVLSFVDGALSRIRYTGDGSEGATLASQDTQSTGSETGALAEDLQDESAAPAVRILDPADGSRWPEGEEIALRGDAFDAKGSPLAGDSLQWSATLHHNDHVHPDFFSGQGAEETVRLDAHAPNVFYELCLTATDDAGRSAAACIDLTVSPADEQAELSGRGTGAGAPTEEPAEESAEELPPAVGEQNLAGGEPNSVPEQATQHGIVRERWLDLSGSGISNLAAHKAFPAAPDKSDILPTLETGGGGKDYGERLKGYLLPPTDGEYYFWIAADDSGELWLSSDDDPANAILIASTTTWTPKRQWDLYPSQASASISLEGDKRYYIEARHKQADQKDNLSVAWQPPGGERSVIPSMYLAPDAHAP